MDGWRKMTVAALAALGLFALHNPAGAEPWTIADYRYGAMATMDEDDAAEDFVGQGLDMAENEIVFDGETCRFEPKIAERDARDLFWGEFRVSPEFLGLTGTTVTEVLTGCAMPGFERYFDLPDGRRIIGYRGMLFILEPGQGDTEHYEGYEDVEEAAGEEDEAP